MKSGLSSDGVRTCEALVVKVSEGLR
jgi:hypothetical protein